VGQQQSIINDFSSRDDAILMLEPLFGCWPRVDVDCVTSVSEEHAGCIFSVDMVRIECSGYTHRKSPRRKGRRKKPESILGSEGRPAC